jgi:hypothetical protein
MRHGRLVATGLAAGAVLGFLAELVRPRPGTPRSSETRVDLTARAPRPVPDPLVDVRLTPVRTPAGSAYTDAVTLAMAARGLGIDRLAVDTDGDVHG